MHFGLNGIPLHRTKDSHHIQTLFDKRNRVRHVFCFVLNNLLNLYMASRNIKIVDMKRTPTPKKSGAAPAKTFTVPVKVSGISVAKKSFIVMLERKAAISSALKKGKSLKDIKGIRFVKPF